MFPTAFADAPFSTLVADREYLNASALSTASVVTASFTTSSRFASNALCGSTTTAGLTTGIPLSTTALATTAVVSSSLTTQIRLGTSALMSTTTTVGLQTSQRFASNALGTTATTSALTTSKPINSVVSATTAVVSASLTTQIRLATTALCQATTPTINLTVGQRFATTALASTTASAALAILFETTPRGSIGGLAWQTTSIAFANNTFLSPQVVTGGQDQYALWSGVGTTRTINTFPSALARVVYEANGRFFTVPYNAGTEVLTSTTGATGSWTSGTLPASATYRHLVWDGAQYFLITTGKVTYTSGNGTSWVGAGTLGIPGTSPVGAAVGNGLVVVAGDTNATNNIYYRIGNGGFTWYGATLPFPPKAVAFFDGRFVVVGFDGTNYYSAHSTHSSTAMNNGVLAMSWTVSSSAPTSTGFNVFDRLVVAATPNGSPVLVALGSNHPYRCYSLDGITWTSAYIPAGANSSYSADGAAYGNGYVVTVNGALLPTFDRVNFVAASTDASVTTLATASRFVTNALATASTVNVNLQTSQRFATTALAATATTADITVAARFTTSALSTAAASAGLTTQVLLRANQNIPYFEGYITTPAVFDSSAYGNGIWVHSLQTGGTPTSTYYTSSDAETSFTARTFPASLNYFDVSFVGGLFIVNDILASSSIYVSSDGINWTTVTMPSSAVWRYPAYTNGQYVIWNTASRVCATSTNGTSWSTGGSAAALFSFNISGCAATNNIFVATANATNVAYSTNGGATWVNGSVGVQVFSVTAANGRFVASASSAFTNVVTSANGSSWTITNVGTGGSVNAAGVTSWGAPVFLYGSGSGQAYSLIGSFDGTSFSTTFGSTPIFSSNRAAWGQDKFVAPISSQTKLAKITYPGARVTSTSTVSLQTSQRFASNSLASTTVTNAAFSPAPRFATNALSATTVLSAAFTTTARFFSNVAATTTVTNSALTTAIQMAATPLASTVASGTTLLTQILMASTPSAGSTAMNATLNTGIVLVGTALAAAATTTDLAAAYRVSSDALGTVTANGQLLTGIALAGTSLSQTTPTANLRAAPRFFSNALASTAASTSMQTAILMGGAALAQTTTNVDLAAAYRFDSIALASANVTAAATTQIRLASTLLGVVTASADLAVKVRFFTTSLGTVATSADLSTQIRLVGSGLAATSPTADLTNKILFAASPLAGAAVFAEISPKALLYAVPSGSALAYAELTTQILAVGTAYGNADGSAALAAAYRFFGVTDGSSLGSASLTTFEIGHPVSDVLNGGWTPSVPMAPLFSMVDEHTANDADYITSPTLEGPSGPAHLGLDYAVPADNCIVQFRARRVGNTGQLRARAYNAQGVVVGATAWQVLTDEYVTYQLPVETIGTVVSIKLEARLDSNQNYPDGLTMLGPSIIYLNSDYVSLT